MDMRIGHQMERLANQSPNALGDVGLSTTRCILFIESVRHGVPHVGATFFDAYNDRAAVKRNVKTKKNIGYVDRTVEGITMDTHTALFFMDKGRKLYHVVCPRTFIVTMLANKARGP